MGSHDTFKYLKHKLWPKEGPWVKVPIWLSLIKSQKSPWNRCVQVVVTYHWKALDKGYNISLDLTSIGDLKKIIMAFQNEKSPNFENFGSPKTKWHLDVAPMANHKEYYKGDGVSFPQVRVVMSVMNLCMLVARSCTKSAPTTH